MIAIDELHEFHKPLAEVAPIPASMALCRKCILKHIMPVEYYELSHKYYGKK
jgi:hypothetical protein